MKSISKEEPLEIYTCNHFLDISFLFKYGICIFVYHVLGNMSKYEIDELSIEALTSLKFKNHFKTKRFFKRSWSFRLNYN